MSDKTTLRGEADTLDEVLFGQWQEQFLCSIGQRVTPSELALLTVQFEERRTIERVYFKSICKQVLKAFRNTK